MTWQVAFHPDFLPEFEGLSETVQNEVAALIKVLSAFGPQLGRPHADTLKGSKYSNMKELRFEAQLSMALGVRIRSTTKGHTLGSRRQVGGVGG